MPAQLIPAINQGTLYDKIDYASGSGSFTYFSNTAGASGFEVTNLITANEPNTTKFVIDGVELSSEWGGGGTPENVNAIWEWTYVHVRQPATSNVVLRVSSRTLSSSTAMHGIDNRATGGSRFSVQAFSRGEVFGLVRTILLLKEQKFDAQIASGQNAASVQLTANCQVTLTLHGTEGGLKAAQ